MKEIYGGVIFTFVYAYRPLPLTIEPGFSGKRN